MVSPHGATLCSVTKMSTTATDTVQEADEIAISSIVSSSRPPSAHHRDPVRDTGLEQLELVEEKVEEYPTGAKFYFICLSMALVLILDGLDSNILATALPAITDDFDSMADVAWYSSAFRRTACSSQCLYGKLYKIFPVKTLLLVSTLIFLAGSITCAAAPSSLVFILGRAVTGLASAGFITGIFTIVVRIMPLRKRPLYTSMYGALESGVIIVAPILGEVLT